MAYHPCRARMFAPAVKRDDRTSASAAERYVCSRVRAPGRRIWRSPDTGAPAATTNSRRHAGLNGDYSQ
jgi:hypothetical protein